MNPIMFLIWIIIMVFIGFPVSFFCAWIYVIALVFAVCCKSCTPIVELLEKGVKLAKYCMEKALA
jgi:hypothetical protein